MRFNYKKIASVLASAVMLSSTAGIALAANYPAPIVAGGAADGAIVITSGNHAGSQVDFWAAVDLQSALQGMVTASGVTSAASMSGEAYPLFTGGTKIYINDSITAVKEVVTETDLPTILAETEFSGDVDADITQTITYSAGATWSYVKFGKEPTDSDDPVVGLKLSTTKGKDLYNLTITFDKSVNFSNTESEGEKITLFGQEFTVGVDTDEDELYLYKSSETFSLSVGGDNPSPSQVVTVEGVQYTVELTAATDSAGTIKVTDSDGNSESKEINEADSKKIQGLEVAINLADESTATSSISAEVTVGAQKVKLKDDTEIKIGSDETAIVGTNVEIGASSGINDVTKGVSKIVIQVRAEEEDSDAIVPGGEFVDPTFGTFKTDFVGLNIERDSTARESFEVKSTQDTATFTMTTHTGHTKTITWYHNDSAKAVLADSNRDYFWIAEMAKANETEYLTVGNEDEGYLLEIIDIANDTDSYTDDEVQFRDVFNPDKVWTTTITDEGEGTVTIGGKQYDVYYYADTVGKGASAFQVSLNFPDTTTANDHAVLWPTIETSKGARVMFYQPTTINHDDWDGRGNELVQVWIPDGDGYEKFIFAVGDPEQTSNSSWNVSTSDDTTRQELQLNASADLDSVEFDVKDGTKAALKINISSTATANTSNWRIEDMASAVIDDPAIVIFEEEDDNNDRHALIIQMEGAGTSADEVGVADIETTWERRTVSSFSQLETDDDLYEYVDLWGTFLQIDKSESSQYSATISYPDEQVYAQIYAAEIAASITGETTTGGGGQILIVKDNEISSVSGQNLVVVGGSCINSVAAKVLDVSYPTCSAGFTAATGVGAGQYLIKAVASPYNAAKTAILVAGYEAADTKNAAAKLKESHVTTVGTSTVYPITSA